MGAIAAPILAGKEQTWEAWIAGLQGFAQDRVR